MPRCSPVAVPSGVNCVYLIYLCRTTNVGQGHQVGHPPTHPTLCLLAQTFPIFILRLHFDLKKIPAKCHHCILHSCDAIALTKSAHRKTDRQINTWQKMQKCFSACYKSFLQHRILPKKHTYSQSENIRLPAHVDGMIKV